MKLIFTLIFLAAVMFTYSQPTAFSWYNSSNANLNYISTAKDQGEQGPCGIFAAVAAVEALSHIYYNKPFSTGSNGLDLSEAEMYSGCSGYGRFEAAASAREALLYVDTTGIINESCFVYPSSSSYFRTDCNNICSSPSLTVDIPGYEELYLTTDQELKRTIIDYGPIIVSAQNIGGVLHSGGGTTSHTFLIIGWSSSGWHIKDSWPGDEYIDYKNFNVFSSTYSSTFWRTKFSGNNEVITCSGNGCSTIFCKP